ncbi:MAG: hypothetical protein ABI834_00665 [Ginsengibacter sp.]
MATISVVAAFPSCKKDNTSSGTADELETTFELSGDQAISDNLNSDAEYVLDEAAADKGFSGETAVGITTTMNVLSCATVSVTPLIGFPKTISIDFGAGCTSTNGVTRSGKINVTLSDSLRKSGSIAVMTFDNYYVSGFKKEGIITWTNTSQGGTKSWMRKCEDGKVTAPNGHYWLHSGSQQVVQTAGASTAHDLIDDVFLITGSHTVTNAAGKTRTSEITEPLEKKVLCDNIDMGKIKIQGPNHFAILDFGNGFCDRIATISIDGSTPKTILLR